MQFYLLSTRGRFNPSRFHYTNVVIVYFNDTPFVTLVNNNIYCIITDS